jgi:hypothetical protein
MKTGVLELKNILDWNAHIIESQGNYVDGRGDNVSAGTSLSPLGDNGSIIFQRFRGWNRGHRHIK